MGKIIESKSGPILDLVCNSIVIEERYCPKRHILSQRYEISSVE